MNTVFMLMTVVSAFAVPVCLVLWLAKLVTRKPGKRMLKRAAVSAGCCVVFFVLFGLTMEQCEHEYELTETVEATCEEDGHEAYRCAMCEREKTEKVEKFGHDMVELRRVEPTYDADGEYVRKCSRCGYEETEVLKQLEKPTEATKSAETVGESSEPEDGEKIDTSVTYDEIYKAYKENELVADDLYQYNRYRITATINGMSTSGLFNLTGGATLTMEKRVGNTRVFFYAEFEKEQEEALKTIKVGDTITFEGECLSAGTWSDCELIVE